ncbi:MAG: hypothetical protein E6K01_00950 [Methanobacteriota archaeon]|nr:MAG: hypothetical protein E6K01_00950 [Euryarchaeota archaeon]
MGGRRSTDGRGRGTARRPRCGRCPFPRTPSGRSGFRR